MMWCVWDEQENQDSYLKGNNGIHLGKQEPQTDVWVQYQNLSFLMVLIQYWNKKDEKMMNEQVRNVLKNHSVQKEKKQEEQVHVDEMERKMYQEKQDQAQCQKKLKIENLELAREGHPEKKMFDTCGDKAKGKIDS